MDKKKERRKEWRRIIMITDSTEHKDMTCTMEEEENQEVRLFSFAVQIIE